MHLKAGSYSDIISTDVFSDESVLRRRQVDKEASRRMPCRRVRDDEILKLILRRTRSPLSKRKYPSIKFTETRPEIRSVLYPAKEIKRGWPQGEKAFGTLDYNLTGNLCQPRMRLGTPSVVREQRKCVVDAAGELASQLKRRVENQKLFFARCDKGPLSRPKTNQNVVTRPFFAAWYNRLSLSLSN